MTIAFTNPFLAVPVPTTGPCVNPWWARAWSVPERFRDRRDAGKQLAPLLELLAADDPVVLGLPRGGVPVAFEVACALHAPLDLLVVRKLGLPWQPELGVGAVGEDDVIVLNH